MRATNYLRDRQLTRSFGNVFSKQMVVMTFDDLCHIIMTNTALKMTAELEFVAVTNIPSSFHAADLRSHFSCLVEGNSFICFHFRHRPEKCAESSLGNKAEVKRCCVVTVERTRLARLLSFSGQDWTDVDGEFVGGQCRVSHIKTGIQDKADAEAVDEEQLLQMPELRPPELMPQGNVGTPTLVFLDLIQRCLLPHNLISKLHLKFPKTSARRIYGNVNLDYDLSGSCEDSQSADNSNIRLLKYHGGPRLTAKPLFKKKPPSELNELKMNKSVINKHLHYTHQQGTDSDQLVVGTDNLGTHSEHVSNSSDADPGTDNSGTHSEHVSNSSDADPGTDNSRTHSEHVSNSSDADPGTDNSLSHSEHVSSSFDAGPGTDNSLSHFEHVSSSSDVDPETQKPEVIRDTSLEDSRNSSSATSTDCSHPEMAVTILKPGLSEDQLRKPVDSRDKFLVPKLSVSSVSCDKFLVPKLSVSSASCDKFLVPQLSVSSASCDKFLVPQLSVSSASCDKFLVPSAIPLKSQKLTNRERRRLEKEERRDIKKLKSENIEEKMIAVEKRYHNDEDAEEWDHHEASEDDPSNQERNTERLYEEEIEQPWEKGGPGVVFYTDAMFWHAKEGDFDEQTTDDLDVDFSAYEEPGAGDKDIKDFLKIRQERRFRDGYDKTDRFSLGIGKRLKGSTNSSIRTKIGKFECHSKGIGRKVMEKQGWTEGQGLGRSIPGIVNALKGEGQASHDKRGLGYTDVKPVVYGLGRTQNSTNRPHLITTIYDDPKITDPKEPLLQRSEPSTLKHRHSHRNKFS